MLATAGNRQHMRSPSAGVLMGVGGAVLGMEVAADGPCSCRVCEPQTIPAVRPPHPTQSLARLTTVLPKIFSSLFPFSLSQLFVPLCSSFSLLYAVDKCCFQPWGAS